MKYLLRRLLLRNRCKSSKMPHIPGNPRQCGAIGSDPVRSPAQIRQVGARHSPLAR
jgi:hypothetical protein